METLPRHILVLGLGRSGVAVARHVAAARDAGADVSVAVLDEKSDDDARMRADSLSDLDVPVTLGATAVDGVYDLVVASPGIPPHSPLMCSARESGAPIVSEIELAYRRSVSPFVAITGTNGKTTTTALVAHLLRTAGTGARAVGNIGTPVIAAVGESGPADVLVTEVSSFQAALTERFHPRVAVLLNITPDHLDWHGSLEAYTADKVKVFSNLGPGDTAVIDIDDEGSRPWAGRVEERGVRVVRVSLKGVPAGGAGLSDGMLALDGDRGRLGLVAASDLAIRGDHNVSNALAGAAAALAMGAGVDAVREGLRTFQPIEHRLEPVGEVAGVRYYNDSKATNPDAVLKALTAFGDDPVIVLLGGRNKGNDFGPLAVAVAARCKLAVLFGESRPELAGAFASSGGNIAVTETMAEALDVARKAAEPGDVVLLSPACASFDQFTSYEDRGDVFRGLVRALEAGEGGRR